MSLRDFFVKIKCLEAFSNRFDPNIEAFHDFFLGLFSSFRLIPVEFLVEFGSPLVHIWKYCNFRIVFNKQKLQIYLWLFVSFKNHIRLVILRANHVIELMQIFHPIKLRDQKRSVIRYHYPYQVIFLFLSLQSISTKNM